MNLAVLSPSTHVACKKSGAVRSLGHPASTRKIAYEVLVLGFWRPINQLFVRIYVLYRTGTELSVHRDSLLFSNTSSFPSSSEDPT